MYKLVKFPTIADPSLQWSYNLLYTLYAIEVLVFLLSSLALLVLVVPLLLALGLVVTDGTQMRKIQKNIFPDTKSLVVRVILVTIMALFGASTVMMLFGLCSIDSSCSGTGVFNPAGIGLVVYIIGLIASVYIQLLLNKFHKAVPVNALIEKNEASIAG